MCVAQLDVVAARPSRRSFDSGPLGERSAIFTTREKGAMTDRRAEIREELQNLVVDGVTLMTREFAQKSTPTAVAELKEAFDRLFPNPPGKSTEAEFAKTKPA